MVSTLPEREAVAPKALVRTRLLVDEDDDETGA